MRIVERDTFLRMPAGTVFCKFPLSEEGDGGDYTFGIESPCILTGRAGDDFYMEDLGDMYYKSGEYCPDTLLKLGEMVDNPGMEYEFVPAGVRRDGLFEDENVGFAVFSQKEVEELIERLQNALELGYYN